MTYTPKAAPRTRFDLDGLSVGMRKRKRAKLARLRAIKRALHLIGFLCYWLIFIGLFYIVFLGVAITFVCLA